jgi:hypothetical protein
MAGLSGTGLVADDLYLLAHNDVTGRPYVQPRALGLGLAGGLLAELMLAGVLGLWDEAVVITGRVPLEDRLARQVLSQVTSEYQRHPVRDWLLYVGRTAAQDVARRLERAGYLAQTGGWDRWRTGCRWRPVDRDNAFAPVLRVRAVLDASRVPVVEGVVLAGLAEACGLGFRLAQYTPARPTRPLDHAVAQLDPGLRELIAHTRAAVDSALLAHRI